MFAQPEATSLMEIVPVNAFASLQSGLTDEEAGQKLAVSGPNTVPDDRLRRTVRTFGAR
ncbi:MAG: cation-transporting P-type ATPase [Rhodomicrobium sp.]